VVNEQVDAHVKDLTKAQLQSIFTGEYTNWNRIVPGFDMPIHVIGRISSSGTRAARSKARCWMASPISSPPRTTA
jgi:ABC-type phosphate transport system substrate-binding protein